MGIWQAIRDTFRMPTLPSQFSADETEPQPIDQMFMALLGSGSSPRVGRTEALTVPAVKRGRDEICSIATLPLTRIDEKRNVVESQLFMQIDPDVPNVVTLAQTVEDLLFEGISWWRVISFGPDGFPSAARHLDVTAVSIRPPANTRTPAPLPSGEDPRGAVVWVDGNPVPHSEIIRFDSPNPGLLKVAGRAIRRAILLDQASKMYAEDPRPLDYFTPAEAADPGDDTDIEGVLQKWTAARRKRGTAYVPAALKYNTVDILSPADLQLVELQKQAVLDIANALGLDPEDLGLSTTSRTYQNAVDRRQDRINQVLAPYMRAITDRLSMGDVVPQGDRVRFHLDDYMKADPRTRWEVYERAVALGAIDLDEIRAREGWPARAMPQPVPRSNRRQLGSVAAVGFSSDETNSVTFTDLPTPSVDEGARTITGLVVPYGTDKIARKNGRRFRFAPGSLQFSELSRVKLLRDHNRALAVGKAIAFNETPEGVYITFKVARGPEGDRVLSLAADGVLDGLSVGVDFKEGDLMPDPYNRGTSLVNRSDLREVSLTAMPAFDDSRVTGVTASRDGGEQVDDATTEQTAPGAPADAPDSHDKSQTFNMDELAGLVAEKLQGNTRYVRRVVNAAPTPAVVTSEAIPYRFDRGGNFLQTEHDFGADLAEMNRLRDESGETEAGKRVMGLFRETFDVQTGDVNELNPNIQRPDMYVDQQDYRYPLWNLINKGAPPNGVQPFTFPKYNSSSGLVGDHTETQEPSTGSFTTTSQTVTPTPISGKAEITRETWDMGGNPAVSTLIWNQMVRGWREGLETAAATFLNTLTSATDVTLTAGAEDDVLAAAWEAAVADLQFERSYDFSAFVVERILYKKFVAARDTAGRPLYPQRAPQNTNGIAQTRFRTLDLGGIVGVPNWALASSGGAPNNSWLFDVAHVHGWASSPQRLVFEYQVKSVEIGIWGYKAFANSDIGAVRQVIYDETA